MVTFEEEKQEEKVLRLRRKEEEETTKLLAQKYGLPYADLSIIPIHIDALGLIKEPEAKEAGLAIIQKIGKKLEIAVKNPELPKTKFALKRLSDQGFNYDLFFVSSSSLEKAWQGYSRFIRPERMKAGEIQVSAERLEEFRAETKAVSDIAKLIAALKGRRTTEVLEIILAGALETEASDIHLEPQADSVRLRYRLDGILNDIGSLGAEAYKLLLSRVKLISEIKLNVRTRGQDGRFTIKSGGQEIEVRASTLPGPYGENIVLRILNPTTIGISFGELGMQPWIEQAMQKELAKPNGMILTTGPTGSGKTTTLYAFVKYVHKPGVKIITLEDPIEYHLAGIEQTQVESEAGYDFPSGLRSILRQDPDVILVGEIRDLETAQTAMHASLTGHLVFSTLHTNDAAGTIPRLLDLGVDPAIMAPAINVTMAQRLVRKLCEKCKESYTAPAKEADAIQKELDEFPAGIPKPILKKKISLFRAKGCPDCQNTGYKKRTGLFEIILVDETVEQLVFRKPSEVDLKNAARKQSQITMRQDGILKVLAGITDFPEIERVVGAG